MTIPSISDAPDPPLRTQTPASFTTDAEAFVDWQASTFVPELQAVIDALNALGLDPTTLDALTDVDTTGATTGQALVYNGTSWEAGTAGGGASATQTAEMIAGFIATPSDKDYRIVVKMAHPGTITETTTVSASGTCTATFKINTTALGGTANSVSSTEQSQAHASANAFAAGDDVVLTISANASCADLSFSIKYTRTLA